MLVLCEPVRLGLEHQPFNSAILEGLLAAGESRVRFMADPGHQAAVLPAVAGAGHIMPVDIELPPRHDPWRRRLSGDWRTARLALEQARADEASDLLFLSCTPGLLLALAWLAPRLGANLRILAIHHGGLIELTRQRFGRSRPLWTGLGFAMRRAERAGVRFLVLEEVIRAQLDAIAPALARATGTLPHPVPGDIRPGDSRSDRRPGTPIRIALLGLATPQKGLRVFLELARAMRERHPGVAEFHFVGRVHEDFAALAAQYAGYIATQPAAEPLARADFRAALERMDYACFFFEGTHYSMTASGVMLDCMAQGLPVIGRHSPLLDSLEARVGTIGVLCQPGMESQAVLEAARMRDLLEYQRFREHMQELGRERSAVATGGRVRDMFDGGGS